MWRDWFYFNKQDRRAMLFLLLCLAAILGIRLYLQTDSGNQEPEIRTIETGNYTDDKRQPHTGRQLKTAPKPFDPNTADSLTLLSAGFPPRVANNIIKYRRAGGVFRKIEDIRKIYGMDEMTYKAVSPYIYIARQCKTAAPETTAPKAAARQTKYEKGTVIDINAADTAELKKIPGIGSYRAKAIIAYRERLGGFISVSQLNEINNMPDSLAAWFYVRNDFRPRQTDLNTASMKEMTRHPYMTKEMAKAILSHRKKYGRFNSWDEMAMYSEFDSCAIGILSRYFILSPAG